MKDFKRRIATSVFAVFSLFLPQLLLATGPDSAVEPAKLTMDWRNTGPSGGDVRALVVDPNDENRFYFGTLDGQMYTSTDGGQNWRLLYNFHRQQLFIDNIIVDAKNSNTLYVGAHRHKDPGGFFKSTDGGKTWRESVELANEAIHSLTQSSANPSVLIAGTNTGLFRSDNSGDSWVRLQTQSVEGLHNVESLAVDPRDSNIIYAGTWYLPYKSTDGGQSWSSIKTGMIDDSDVFAIDIDPRDPNHVIASACSGIYDSKNSGNMWRKVQGIPSQSRRTRAIMQHPSVPGLVFAGTTEGFWRSTNGGADGSWMLMTSKQLEINSIAVHPHNPMTVLIGTNNYGVMLSKDGGKNFQPSNNGYSGRFINALLTDREKPDRIYATTINTATGGGFFFISPDGGETWQPSMRNMPARLVSYSILQDRENTDIIYLATSYGLYISRDRGSSWAPVNAPKPQPATTTPPARKRKPAATRRARPSAQGQTARSSVQKSTIQNPVAVSANPPAVNTGDETVRKAQIALNTSGFKVGEPDGKLGKVTIAAIRSFQADRGIPVTGKLDSETLVSMGIKAEGPTLTADGRIVLTDMINSIVATGDQRDGRTGIIAATNSGLYRTYDPEKGWEKVNIPGNFDARINTVSTSTSDPQTIWIGTARSGVLVSRDNGTSWEQASDVPTDFPVLVIKQDPNAPSHIYVGTKQSFYMSTNNGGKWTRRGGNLPYGEFPTIVINPRNSKEIFVGNTFDQVGGVYRSIDGGSTWSRVDPRDRNLPSQRIWALELSSGGTGKLFVGSHSAGIYVAQREGESTAATNGR